VICILDTCTFIWLCSEPSALSEKARMVIDDAGMDLTLSDVSAMEITMKWTAGKIVLPDPPRIWIEAQARKWALASVEVTRNDIYRSGELPDHHRDPFDRLLIATAINQEATILTPDVSIRRYPVSTCW
jgi:PIN domain nuclease of toxin-antitoxin system